MEGINDPKELLVCARYEFFRGEPIEKAYKNFCEIVGNDAMNYQDFDFWWYQFKAGNFDLDSERSKIPPKQLGDMPVDIMEAIFENLKLKERAICRKVSRDVRDVIDNIKFTMKYIEIDSSDDSIELAFNCEIFIKYTKTDSGCRVESVGNSKIINGADFRQTAYADLKTIFNNPKLKLGSFYVDMKKSVESRTATLSDISACLSSLGHQLNVKCVLLYAKSQKEVLAILPYLKPRVLEEIYFRQYQFGASMLPELKMDQVFDLDQWKQAKIFDSGYFFFSNFKVESFLHFNDIHVYIDAISKEDVIRLTNTFLASPDFKSCNLKIKSNKSYEDVIEILGEENLAIPGSASHINVVYLEHNTVSLTKLP